MPSYRALHFCLPNDDNLGDELAHSVLPDCFEGYGVGLDVRRVDIRNLRTTSTFLDDKIESYNQDYDLIVVGAGGLLLPFFIDGIFEDPDSWSRIEIPLVFFGVGIIGEFAEQSWYTAVNPRDNQHVVKALNAAVAISVRDLRTWLFTSRLVKNHRNRIFITGCPTVFQTKAEPINCECTHDMAINLPFTHAGCNKYQKYILQLAELIVRNVPRIKWICHSAVEFEHATRFRREGGFSFDIAYPRTAPDVGKEYASCKFGFVTKAHAAIFCLANNIPFGFLSYDMKCDALMEMIVDHPHHYLCHIDEIKSEALAGTIQKIINNLMRDSNAIKRAQCLLLEMFNSEFDEFIAVVKGGLSK